MTLAEVLCQSEQHECMRIQSKDGVMWQFRLIVTWGSNRKKRMGGKEGGKKCSLYFSIVFHFSLHPILFLGGSYSKVLHDTIFTCVHTLSYSSNWYMSVKMFLCALFFWPFIYPCYPYFNTFPWGQCILFYSCFQLFHLSS